MSDNQKGMLVGGAIVVLAMVLFGYANSLQPIIPIATTQTGCIIFGLIGGAIAIISTLKEIRIL